MTNPEGKKPSDQPDLGKAARDLWTAAKVKAKEVGGKAAEKAKDLGAKAIQEAKHVQDTGQPGKDPSNPASSLKDKALDVWRRAPTLVVVCGVGILVLCSSCCICAGLFSLLSGPRQNQATAGRDTRSVSSDGDATESVTGSTDDDATQFTVGKTVKLRSYNDTPPVVSQWMKRMGCTVYEIRDWQNTDRKVKENHPETLYAVVDGEKLVSVYLKMTSLRDWGTETGPHWTEMNIHKKRTENGSIEAQYTFDPTERSLVYQINFANEMLDTRVLHRILIHVEKSSKEGYWDGTYSRTDRSLTNPPSFPDQHEETKITRGRGGKVIVHRS